MRGKIGWIKDHKDERDHSIHDEIHKGRFLKVTRRPSSMDLRSLCSPVETQVNIGSCTSQAIVGALEIVENIKHEAFINLSRLFVYWNERNLEGTVSEDSGAFIRDGIKVISTLGVCDETLWPYDEDKYILKPPQPAFDDAIKHKIQTYARVPQTADDLRNVIASGFPVIFGIQVYASFDSDEVAKTGFVPMPKDGEECEGGHAILAVGYDDSIKSFLIRNSWGTDWGIGGYFWLPYDYVTNADLADDFWVVQS